MIKITLLFFLCSTVMFSQRITGKVYDDEAPIAGAKIMNISSNSITSSDAFGNFDIYAQTKDTLIFTSLFHHTKKVVVSDLYLNEVQVFELTKKLNELDEVDLQGPVTPKTLDAEEATKTMNEQFQSDVEKNPHLYRRPNTNSGPIDIIEIGRRVVKLFKRKTPKESETIVGTITSGKLDTLFKEDKFFNDKFLILDLNITKDYKYLFFAFCESKQIPATLLLPENNFYLIDEFLLYSAEFRKMLAESQN